MKYLAKPFMRFIQIGHSMDRTQLMKTNSSLFANDVLATDLVIGRFLNTQGYIRQPDGSINLNLPSIVVDVQSFYLFTHKLLISALLMLRNYLPEEYARKNNFPIGKFGEFYKYVQKEENEFAKLMKQQMSSELDWAKVKIIDKRDKMVQHWTTKLQNQLVPTLIAFDLPVLAYQHPDKFEASVNSTKLNYWTEKIARKHHIQFSPNNGAGHNLAFLEAWYPKLEKDEKARVDSFINPDLFIALPVSPVIVDELSAYLEKIADIIEQVRSNGL